MKTASIFVACGLLGLPSLRAATISWSNTEFTTNGGFGENLDTGIFDQSDVISTVLAENVGGAAEVFDGISFAAGTISFGNTNPTGISSLGYHQGTPVGNSDLARFGTYSGTAGASTVNLSGLTIGNYYRIQLLIFDGIDTSAGRTVEVDGQDQGAYANGVFNVTWGTGMLITGTFQADSLTQDFDIEIFDGSTSLGGQLNAIIVQQIPEPSVALIGGLGFLALLRRRR